MAATFWASPYIPILINSLEEGGAVDLMGLKPRRSENAARNLTK